jgi:protein AroM
MKPTIVLLTVGRGPRVDILPDIERRLQGTFTIVEQGALDRVADEKLARLAPSTASDALVASLGSGREAKVSKTEIAALLQSEITRLQDQVHAFGILCTIPFPTFRSTRPVAQVGCLLLDAVRSPDKLKRLGVLMPIAEQQGVNETLWAHHAEQIITAIASPYQGVAGVVDAARDLARKGADLIVMSCMGYNETMRLAVCDATLLPTVAPGQVLTDFLEKELAHG